MYKIKVCFLVYKLHSYTIIGQQYFFNVRFLFKYWSSFVMWMVDVRKSREKEKKKRRKREKLSALLARLELQNFGN